MIHLISTVAWFVYHVVIMFSLLTACAHLRDINDSVQELASVSYFLSEINRKLNALEKRLQPKEIKAD